MTAWMKSLAKTVIPIWVLSVCLIGLCSLIPRVELPVDFWNADKVYHFIAYSWLGVLPIIGFASRKVGATASLSMVIVGLSLEIGQSYVPGRVFSFVDMGANSLGVVVGMICGKALRARLGIDA